MDGSTLNGVHTSCISAEELIRYREGKLTDERLEVVRCHLEGCLLCLDALMNVNDTGDDTPVTVPPDFMTRVNKIARKAWLNEPAKKPSA